MAKQNEQILWQKTQDVLPRIFEPLYSTKGFGVGLGKFKPNIFLIIVTFQGFFGLRPHAKQ
jgi:hypothetical protein